MRHHRLCRRLGLSCFMLPLCFSLALALVPDNACAQQNDTPQNSRPVPRLILDEENTDQTSDPDNESDQLLSGNPQNEESETDSQSEENLSPEENTEENAPPDSKDASSVIKGHGFQLAMSFLGVPDSFMDPWFSHHGSTWDGVANMGVQLDYFLRFNVPCEMRFSLSWFSARTGGAYWLDDSYSDTPSLSDYVYNNISLVNIEVAAYHIVPIIDEIAFYYGGGFWGGVLLGNAKSYPVRNSCAQSSDSLSSCEHEPSSAPVYGLPDVFGFVMVTAGFKFTVWDIMTIRAEGGFKGYFYGQIGLGVEF